MIRILQLSDLHLLGDKEAIFLGINPYQSFHAVLSLVQQEVQKNHPQCVLLTGDLSQDASGQSYQYIVDAFNTLKIPIAWVLGNHDDPIKIEKYFRRKFVYQTKSLIFKDWHIILLNSQWPGNVAGYLSDNELLFLEKHLKAKVAKHVMLVLHHQVLPIGSHWMDEYVLKNQKDFFKIIDRFSSVKLVIHGHVHQEKRQQRKKVFYLSTPSTSFQFLPNVENFALDKIMPGYRWINLYTNGTYKTGIKRIEYAAQFVPNLDSKGY